jgi:hypothetical protein
MAEVFTHAQPADPGTSCRVLKENDYKSVTLTVDASGRKTITKRYAHHKPEHLAANTRYVADVLAFFRREFSGIATIPQCFGVDLEQFEVSIEFIPALPDARVLNKRTFALAAPFFERCYEIRDDRGFLRPMSGSIYYTEAMRQLIDSGFPLALGMKGDLWQNLCLANGELILADIDSAALEPLGLSELIMTAEIAASFRTENFNFQGKSAHPVCFRHLSRSQGAGLITIALEIFDLRLTGGTALTRSIKRRVATHKLKKLLDLAYT